MVDDKPISNRALTRRPGEALLTKYTAAKRLLERLDG
jgi:hypothetical protein